MTSWYGRLPRPVRWLLWLALGAWVAGGIVLLVFGGRTVLRRNAGPSPTPPPGDLVLVAVQGAGADPPALALGHRDAQGSHLILLPAGTIVEVPGQGAPASFTRALEIGPEALVVSVANVLGTRVPTVAIASPDRAAALVDAVGGVVVNVPETVIVERSGFREPIFERGRRRMAGAEWVQYMTLAVAEQTEPERVARQDAGWRALTAGIGTENIRARRALGAFGGDASVTQLVRVLSGRLPAGGVVTLPVRRSAAPGAELYDVSRDELQTLRRRLDDVVTVTTRQGRRVRLLLGAQGPLGPAVGRILVENGYTIVLSGATGSPYDQTTVVATDGDPELLVRAREIVKLMGTGTVGVSRAPQSLVDVTLVVGRDWAIAHNVPQPAPTPVQTPRPTRRSGRI